MNKIKIGSIIGLIFALILIIFSFLVLILLPILTRSLILKNVPLQNGSYSFSQWRSPTHRIKMDFWLYNVTNPDEVLLRGEKPSLVRKGPYSFDEYQEKMDIFFENDTNNFIMYRNFKRYVFNRTSSCHFCDLDDIFVVPNVPYLTAVNTLNNMPDMSNILQSIFHVTLLAIGEHPFTAQKARFLLFEGYKDTLFSLLQWLKYLPQFRDVPDRMGFFYPKNRSDDGPYKIDTGIDNAQNVGKIVEWNGQDRLQIWNSDLCNKIKGSDGTLFPPFVSKSTILRIFVSDICRSIYATFHSDVDVRGIRAYRFVIPRSTSDSKNPENEGFCQPTGQIFYPNSQPSNKNSTSYCLPDGLLNLTKCRFGAPVVVSNPNFLFSPQEVYDSVEGLSEPNVEDDSSVLDIEPNTGAVLSVQSKLQVNVAMYNIGSVLRYLKPVIVPVLMLNESAQIGQEFHDYLYKSFVTGPSLAHSFEYVFFVVGILGSTATVLILVGLRRRRNTNVTERRIRAWSHAVVPDHLRTKVDDRVLTESRPVVDNPTIRTPTSAENLQKLINQLNKACQNASELLLNASKDEIDVEGPRIEETSKPEDTRQLVGAVSMGLGLRPPSMPSGPTPMNPQMTQVPGGKYPSTVKSALKSTAANMAQPYGAR